MLEKKCVGDNFKIWMTVLAFLVTNIHYLFTLASVTNIQKMSSTSRFSHQYSQIVTNITISPTPLTPLIHFNIFALDAKTKSIAAN